MDRDDSAGRLPVCRGANGGGHGRGRGRAPTGAPVPGGSSVRQSERRCRAGLLRRRCGRGHHHGAVALQVVRRDRTQFELRLQGAQRRCAAGRRRSRRPLRARGQRPAGGQPAQDHGAARRRRLRSAYLGGQFRRRARRRVRLPGPHHAERCDPGRATCPVGGDRALAAGAAEEHRRLRHLPERLAEALSGDRRGQQGGLSAALKGASARPR